MSSGKKSSCLPLFRTEPVVEIMLGSIKVSLVPEEDVPLLWLVKFG
jgi:hypothetical protein